MYLLAALGGAMGLYLFWWKNQQDNSGNGADDSGGGVLDTISTAGARLVNALTSRGYRNNNPGNLRYVANNPWQGQTGNDNGYGIYDTPENGTRALGHQLRAYGARGLDTVKLIISTWAPSNENDTIAYIGDVSTQLSVGTDEPIDVEDRLADLAQAIARHENGYLDSSYNWSWVYDA